MAPAKRRKQAKPAKPAATKRSDCVAMKRLRTSCFKRFCHEWGGVLAGLPVCKSVILTPEEVSRIDFRLFMAFAEGWDMALESVRSGGR